MQVDNYKRIIEPLNWLIGRWTVLNAKGCYPTINPFQEFIGEIEFSCNKQPFLYYEHRSWLLTNKTPVVIESGFLRLKPSTNKIAFSVTHNIGMVSVEEGIVHEKGLKLKSTSISRISFNKDPTVTAIERYYMLDGDNLQYILYMQTKYAPLIERARITFKKVE